jgi:predicted nucleotidyltransferase
MISLKSKISQKVLGYFFLNPQEQLYINEISQKLKLDKRNLVKKLKEFENEGLLKKSLKGNLKLYSANTSYPLYNEYKGIIFVTCGVESSLRKIMAGIGGVSEAYIYGSYARNTMDAHSDIDVLAIGSHSALALQRGLTALQKTIGREINAVNMGVAEFNRKKAGKDSFVTGILGAEKIRIFP